MPDVYEATIRKMSDYITSRLIGSDESFKRILSNTAPSRNIIVGTLANVIEDKGTKKSSVQESSITLKFKIKDIKKQLHISIFYSIYSEDNLTNEEKTNNPNIKTAWKRVDFSDSFDLSLPHSKTPLSFRNGSDKIDGYSAYVELKSEKLDGEEQICICVQNDSKSDKANKYLYNVKIQAHINKAELSPYHYEYYYEGMKQVFDYNYRTINCTAFFNHDETMLTTDPIPRFEQVKKKLKTSDRGFSFNFSIMDSEKCLIYLEEYETILNNYVKEYSLLIPSSDKEEEFFKSMDNFRSIVEDYHNAISFLKNEPAALYAFRLMNRVFELSSEHKTWRIFQILFILCDIPKVSTNNNSNECDVIHIATGGGKTEAYLGIAIYLMFYTRIKGYLDGTIAIVKFPLRMLSIQQIERVASKIVFAEKIRKEEHIGGAPFSTSFLVGNSTEYPNYTNDAIEKIKDGDTSGKILRNCPICGGDLELHVSEYFSIAHHCTKCGEDHRLYYSDEETYRYLPTLIISTVDKFSIISSQRFVKNLFGAKLHKCNKGHGYFPIGDRCRVCGKSTTEYTAVDMSKISTPQIIVQDELHLIRESLGSIDAHFESFCEELQYSLARNKPKRIAMTATITGCSEQIDQLYGKKAKVFPGPNPYTTLHPNELNNPFSEIEYEGDVKKLHRLIIGLKPNGRDNQFATSLTIKYTKQFVKELLNGNIKYPPEYNVNSDVIKDVVSNITSMLTYHNKKADVFSTSHLMDPVLSSDRGGTGVLKKSLTGESNADEIRGVINSVKDFETSPDKLVHITSATSIVSHGVDLKKWNFMEFQGIPNNTAEYIQSSSRVGRTLTGLVFIWFYPNRVRDISMFHNFIEYHSIIDHKVEPVSINKWTKLSFYETCTSIFLGSILNYLSAIHCQSLYTRSEFKEAFKNGNSTYKQELIDFIQKVYHTDLDNDGAKLIREIIPSEIEERIKYLLEAYPDREKNFFPNIMKLSGKKYYGVQTGMRGIQKEVRFIPNMETKELIERLSQ